MIINKTIERTYNSDGSRSVDRGFTVNLCFDLPDAMDVEGGNKKNIEFVQSQCGPWRWLGYQLRGESEAWGMK